MLATLGLLGATLVAGHLLAPRASAGGTLYEGALAANSGASIDFRLVRDHGKRLVRDFHANDVPTVCGDETSLSSLGIREFKVNKEGEFGGKRRVGGSRIGAYAVVKAELRRSGAARGTIRISVGFDDVPICESGTLRWKAER